MRFVKYTNIDNYNVCAMIYNRPNFFKLDTVSFSYIPFLSDYSNVRFSTRKEAESVIRKHNWNIRIDEYEAVYDHRTFETYGDMTRYLNEYGGMVELISSEIFQTQIFAVFIVWRKVKNEN